MTASIRPTNSDSGIENPPLFSSRSASAQVCFNGFRTAQKTAGRRAGEAAEYGYTALALQKPASGALHSLHRFTAHPVPQPAFNLPVRSRLIEQNDFHFSFFPHFHRSFAIKKSGSASAFTCRRLSRTAPLCKQAHARAGGSARFRTYRGNAHDLVCE